MDEVALALRPLCDAATVEFLKKADIAITPLDTGHVLPDCDVFAMDNSWRMKHRT